MEGWIWLGGARGGWARPVLCCTREVTPVGACVALSRVCVAALVVTIVPCDSVGVCPCMWVVGCAQLAWSAGPYTQHAGAGTVSRTG